MKLLQSVISLISNNTRNELRAMQQSRLFCTTKSGNNEIKSNENKIDDKSISPNSAPSDEEKMAFNKRAPVDQEDSNLSNVKKGILITSYSTAGFRLNQQLQVIGPIILFPRAVLAWHVESAQKVDADSLMIFSMIQPKVDTLIIGVGSDEVTKNIGTTILKFAHEFKINVEILATEMACTQYNLLTSEGRMVGAALIPPKAMTWGEDDVFHSLSLDGKLFTVDMLHSPDIRDARDGKMKLI